MKKQTIRLWENEIPGYIKYGEKPALTYYEAENRVTDATVIICPGGGYVARSPHEGEGYALFLNSLGMDAFVLDYRVSPTRFPYPLLDARRAVRLVRERAEIFKLRKDRIAIMGSSAGGHLSALLSTYRGVLDGEGVYETDAVDYLPNAQILCYPVIEIDGHKSSYELLLGDRVQELYESVTPTLIADDKTPPAFMWHTAEDATVNVINTYNYAKRLRELNVPCEMHIFPYGKHGLGLANEGTRDIPHVSRWSGLLKEWLTMMDFLPER